MPPLKMCDKKHNYSFKLLYNKFDQFVVSEVQWIIIKVTHTK